MTKKEYSFNAPLINMKEEISKFIDTTVFRLDPSVHLIYLMNIFINIECVHLFRQTPFNTLHTSRSF